MSDSAPNPYAYHWLAESVDTPHADVPQYKLFSIPWIVFAAFLGSLAAAGLLLAMNFSRRKTPSGNLLWTAVGRYRGRYCLVGCCLT